MNHWTILFLYVIVGIFCGRVYYNCKMASPQLWHDGSVEVQGVIVMVIWPIWVGFHVVRLTVLSVFKCADFFCAKGY